MEEMYEQIERYVENELSESDRQAFETACLSDNSLMQELAFYLSSRQAVISVQEDQLKQTWIDTYSNNRPSGRKIPFYPLLAAAIFIILLLTYFGYHAVQPRDMASLYISYHEVSEVSVVRGPDSAVFQEADSLYNEKLYQKAIPVYLKVLELPISDTAQNRARYYLGHSYLNTDQPRAAIEAFEQIDTTYQYTKDAQWYIALAYIKLKRPQQASGQLDKLLEDPGSNYYSKKANALKRELQKVIKD